MLDERLLVITAGWRGGSSRRLASQTLTAASDAPLGCKFTRSGYLSHRDVQKQTSLLTRSPMDELYIGSYLRSIKPRHVIQIT